MMWNLSKYHNNVLAVTEDNQEIRYGQFEVASKELIRHISGRCLVFNLCQNKVGSLLGYIAFLNNRIVPVLLDAHLNRELLAALITTYKPDYLWIPSEMKEEFSSYTVKFEIFDYALIKTEYTAAFALYDDLGLLLTTSGSTGSPKLVRQSYANIKANTESIVQYLELDETERPITTLPMSYTYGLSILNSHLYVGASVVMTNKTVMHKEFWQQFAAHGATSFGGVPYVYEMLEKLRFFRMNLPTLRYMTQAGGKLSPELHKKFAEYARDNGKKFIVMYGQTEATARMSYLPADKSLEKYGSMGIAIPGGKFSLIDVDGNVITEPDIVGELVYEGKNVTLGYAECGEDLQKGDERQGVLVTGDMAKRDADGYYFIVGRKKRFLKIFGSRVNLDETERMLKDAFRDADFACGGKDDLMYIFFADVGDEDAILKFLVQRTGLNRAAFRIQKIDSVPKNESGKTLYSALEKYYD